jgi:hypothetical protein
MVATPRRRLKTTSTRTTETAAEQRLDRETAEQSRKGGSFPAILGKPRCLRGRGVLRTSESEEAWREWRREVRP